MKRKISKWMLSMITAMLLLMPSIALAAPEGSWMVATQSDGYIVVNEVVTATESVVIHQEPSDSSAILGELLQGQQVVRIGISTTSGWNRIEYNGQIAYVWGEYVTAATTPTTPETTPQSSETGLPGVTETADDMYVLAVQNSIIRSIPDPSGAILGYFNTGDVAHRIAVCSNTWSKIEFNGIVGYIGGQIVGTSAPETSVPETPAPETPAPETPAPETPAPETSAPETSAPETSAPETSAPETSTAEVTEESTQESVGETSTEEMSSEEGSSVETNAEDATAGSDESGSETGSTVENGTQQSGKSQVSIWKIVFFIFIILLVVNSIILVATILKKDEGDDLDEAEDDEEDEDSDH